MRGGNCYADAAQKVNRKKGGRYQRTETTIDVQAGHLSIAALVAPHVRVLPQLKSDRLGGFAETLHNFRRELRGGNSHNQCTCRKGNAQRNAMQWRKGRTRQELDLGRGHCLVPHTFMLAASAFRVTCSGFDAPTTTATTPGWASAQASDTAAIDAPSTSAAISLIFAVSRSGERGVTSYCSFLGQLFLTQPSEKRRQMCQNIPIAANSSSSQPASLCRQSGERPILKKRLRVRPSGHSSEQE